MNPTFTDGSYDATLDVRERTGGPGRPRKPSAASRDFYERFVPTSPSRSHMPLDTDPQLLSPRLATLASPCGDKRWQLKSTRAAGQRSCSRS